MMKMRRMKLLLISFGCILVMVKPSLCETQDEIETITFTSNHLKVKSTVDQGQRVRLDCSKIFGKSKVKDVGYFWVANHTVFSTEPKPVILANSDIEYACTARGIAGKMGTRVAKGSVIIRVTGPPYNINVNPMERTVMINNKTTSVPFTCTANKASYYYWLRGSDEIPSDAEFKGSNNNSLVLHNILPSDSGTYQCVAVNEHGKTYSYLAKLTIKVLPPVVTVEPELLEAKKGEYAEFNCSAVGIGSDDFRYQWFLNKDLIPGQNSTTLVINNISQHNAGDYTCSVYDSLYGGIGRSGVARLTLNEYCHSVTVEYSGFSITWNETLIGDTVDAPCTGTGLNGAVNRRCMGDNQWDESIECFIDETKMLFDQAANLSSLVNELNETDRAIKISSIVSRLANITAPTEEAIFAMDINMAVKIVSTLNSATETIINMLNSTDAFFEDATSVVNNLLSETNKNNWQQLARNLSTSNQDLVKDTEQLTKLLSKTLNSDTSSIMKTKDNTVIKAEQISNADIIGGYRFPSHHDDLTQFNGGAFQLSVPSSLLQKIWSSKITTTITVISNANNLRLPSPNNGNITQAISASTIFSLQMDPLPNSSNFVNSNDSIMITFNMRDQDSASRLQDFTLDDVACSFYDHTLINNFNEFGGWSMEGVTVDGNNSNETSVTCLTTHLTSFAVLVSIRDGQPLSIENKALSVISYIGCAISFICLGVSILVLAYVIYKSKKDINLLFIHLNLCVALALGLAVFIAGIERATANQIACKAVAVLLQYLFISAFCWMLCEGVMLYMMLVTVFGNKLNKKRFFFVLGWGPVILIVGASAGLAHEQYGTDHYCWIKSNDGAIFAFIGPIASIILVWFDWHYINFMFLTIALKVIAVDRQNLKRAKADSNGDIIKGLLKALIVLLPLLGVTWIIGVLAVNDNTQVFAWIFAILNSLQGVFIFIFTVIRNKQVTAELMKHWKYNATSKKVSSNGSANASQKRASLKTHGDTSFRHNRVLSGRGYFGSILGRQRNWLRKSETHKESVCEDNQVKLTAIRKKELVLELHNVTRKGLKCDKIDGSGNEEKKKSIKIGEDSIATVSVEPDLAVLTPMPINTV